MDVYIICIVMFLHIHLIQYFVFPDTNREKSEFVDILLMQLNTHAHLACPEYSGPYLETV